MSTGKIERYGKLRFAALDMGCLSGKSFEEVFRTNDEFVEFTLNNMSKGTGIFKFWLEYINLKKSQHA